MPKSSESLKSQPCRFTGLQVALGHFSFPLGGTSEAIDNFREIRDSLAERADGDSAELLRALTPCKVVQTAGQADLLLAIPAPTFRLLPKIALRAFSSNIACQWSLGKEITARPASSNGPNRLPLIFSAADATPSLVCYLRTNRRVYRDGGGLTPDCYIVRKLEDLLATSDCSGLVAAGLGWFDYIVVADIEGSVSAASRLVRRFLMLTSENKPVFQRTLTIVGFTRSVSGQTLEDFPPLTDYGLKFRVAPGAGHRATDEIVSFLSLLGNPDLSPTDYRLFHSAGKKDVFFLPNSAGLRLRNPLLDPYARTRLRQLKEMGILTAWEVNLTLGFDALYSVAEATAPPTQQAAEKEEHSEDSQPTLAAPPFCTCRGKVSLDFCGLEAILPTGTRDSIRAVYSFFGTVLNDPFRCCDLVHSIVSCHDGLLSILGDLKRLRNEKHATSDAKELDRISQWEQATLAEIQVWCSRVEKVVGERCAGSFESKLVPGDTLAPHRGHINKLLITADNLVAEYLTEITDFWELQGQVTVPVFHFGATDSVQSDLDSGVVTLPSKYAFSLPLSIPQLWQEAGVRVFQRKYSLKFSEDLAPKVAAYLKRPGLKDEHIRVAKSERQVIADLADHFSDLLVRYFGFGSRDAFLDYLITLACSRYEIRNGLLPKGRENQYWLDVLRRLFFVFETDYLICANGAVLPSEGGVQPELPRDTLALFKLDRSRLERRDQAMAAISEDIRNAIEDLHDAEVLAEPEPRRIDKEKILPLLGRAEAHVLSEAYVLCHGTYIDEFVTRFLKVYSDAESQPLVSREMEDSAWTDNLDRLEAGELVDLGSVVSRGAYFADAFSREGFSRLTRRELNGAGMAAVGRSAFLSFLAVKQPPEV